MTVLVNPTTAVGRTDLHQLFFTFVNPTLGAAQLSGSFQALARLRAREAVSAQDLDVDNLTLDLQLVTISAVAQRLCGDMPGSDQSLSTAKAALINCLDHASRDMAIIHLLLASLYAGFDESQFAAHIGMAWSILSIIASRSGRTISRAKDISPAELPPLMRAFAQLDNPTRCASIASLTTARDVFRVRTLLGCSRHLLTDVWSPLPTVWWTAIAGTIFPLLERYLLSQALVDVLPQETAPLVASIHALPLFTTLSGTASASGDAPAPMSLTSPAAAPQPMMTSPQMTPHPHPFGVTPVSNAGTGLRGLPQSAAPGNLPSGVFSTPFPDPASRSTSMWTPSLQPNLAGGVPARGVAPPPMASGSKSDTSHSNSNSNSNSRTPAPFSNTFSSSASGTSGLPVSGGSMAIPTSFPPPSSSASSSSSATGGQTRPPGGSSSGSVSSSSSTGTMPAISAATPLAAAAMGLSYHNLGTTPTPVARTRISSSPSSSKNTPSGSNTTSGSGSGSRSGSGSGSDSESISPNSNSQNRHAAQGHGQQQGANQGSTSSSSSSHTRAPSVNTSTSPLTKAPEYTVLLAILPLISTAANWLENDLRNHQAHSKLCVGVYTQTMAAFLQNVGAHIHYVRTGGFDTRHALDTAIAAITAMDASLRYGGDLMRLVIAFTGIVAITASRWDIIFKLIPLAASSEASVPNPVVFLALSRVAADYDMATSESRR
ncbi:uncharacterized protein AMSG_10819 [Thecamonas trahens ATCC 50062]|uniref:Uncharacterized protein n=1 Tax=Thecamonas trahens ATCC 50062 TaxID=461836 RepID=A0A0L0DUN6_THETB|nr:hypothetical protein AMSG_10819 [Thecamonas trahens ATCC 50062]KNC55198.1 hypothetical protein AMSG_10819 [Thecamonas trahens ATCC 50062]|eukprot:XP_013753248.1 hypothetical protein AMSG_10819 [Thecamonas trahens ATCC 50062]